mmetsp:Transcript_13917/g.40070  ORF Transcript_13917/g.40070 Transcript_13917/m.40070 type:complete len:231 (+) Transcript_13917:1575-2267(+)
MLCTDTPRKPFSRYQGMAMLFWKTGNKSGGTWLKKSFMSTPPCLASVSRTRTMFLPNSTAHRNSCSHHRDCKMPSVMKNTKAPHCCTPRCKVICSPSCMSTSTSTNILMPGRASFKNICMAMIASCAFRCKCDKKMSYVSLQFELCTDCMESFRLTSKRRSCSLSPDSKAGMRLPAVSMIWSSVRALVWAQVSGKLFTEDTADGKPTRLASGRLPQLVQRISVCLEKVLI